jgi:hypothetical protein
MFKKSVDKTHHLSFVLKLYKNFFNLFMIIILT